jgi:hypothetical protein
MERKRQKPASGCYAARDTQRIWPQIVIRFDLDTFAQIQAAALKQQISFAAMVRQLCENSLPQSMET